MALSKIIKFGEICSSKSRLLTVTSREPHCYRPLRSFRSNRKNVEPNLNPNSVATPFQTNHFDCSQLSIANIWKPLGFTIVFSTACFGGAAIWEYENMRSHAVSMLKRPLSIFKRRSESRSINHPYIKEITKWWNSLSAGERIFVPICALNILVFGAWRVPRWQPFMLKWFCSNPGSPNVCLPMLLSTFSHYSSLHLLANMYVLHSFSTGAAQGLGKEQFLGLYLSAGVISSLTSYVYKIVTKQPGLSLGASGAIMAILGYVCTQYPDTRLAIILLPIFSFSAGTAIKFVMGLDAAGVILGWKFFDHAAHLGGASFGVFWAMYGYQNIWQKREPFLQYWHAVRGAVK